MTDRRTTPGPLSVTPAALLYRGGLYSPMVMGNLAHTSTVLLRRERFEQVRELNEQLRSSGQDHDSHLRTCRPGPVAFVNLATIEYQKGMPDRLAGAAYNIFRARNFLKTITPVLENDRDRIHLPVCMPLSDVHPWLGETGEARRHLAHGLGLRPWQPRSAALLRAALLPRRAGKGVRSLFRRVKALVHAPVSREWSR